MPQMTEQSTLKIIIRPKRIAFLVPPSICEGDFSNLLEFIGSLWGGKYFCIVPFDSENVDNVLGMNWLTQYSPDTILWLESSCNEQWVTKIKEAINPLNIYPLQEPLSKNFQSNRTGLFHFWPVIKNYSRGIRSLPDTTTRFQFISTDSNVKNKVFYHLSFGVVDKKDSEYLAELLRADSSHIVDENISDFIRLHHDAKKTFTFLDASSTEIETINAFGSDTPTIFVLSSTLIDYTWFWNNRAKFSSGANACIAIPLDSLCEVETIKALVIWLEGFHVGKANYCEITSISATKGVLDTLAKKLRPSVKKSGYEYVDVNLVDEKSIPTFRLQHKQVEVNASWLDKQSFEFMVPTPSFISEIENRSSSQWTIEIEGGGSLRNHTPPNICEGTNTKILNTPSIAAPSYMFGGGYSKRYSSGNIVIPCVKKMVSTQVTLPTFQELLVPLFKHLGIKAEKDEKQLCYQSVIELFGGLRELIECCKGKRYDIISTFWKDNLLPCEKNGLSLSKGCSLKRADTPIPIALGTIKGRAKLGSSYKKVFQSDYLDNYDIDDEMVLALVKERFSFSQRFDRQLTPQSFIAWMIDMKVARRVVYHPQCPACKNNSGWSVKIDLSSPLFCSYCGSNISIPAEKFELGYQLNPLVYKAFEEGVRPVALVLSVLKRVSHGNFEYIPGFKGSYKEKGFDIDIIASCDGELVFCECKNMENVATKAKKWEEIKQQLEDLIEKGRLCGARSVILASLADKYPQSIIKIAKKESSSDLRVILLNKEDLLRGYVRSTRKGLENSSASFYEAFLPQVRPKNKRKGQRTISFGSVVESK